VTGADWLDANRAMWDERVPIHVDSDFYDVAAFRARPDRIRPFEADEVGDVAGKDLVHLQCHFGLDTLSWATRGARVTGLDFSRPAVDAARTLAAELRVDAEFVEGVVDDAVSMLGGRSFDIAYTGIGAINWLPDIERWAQVVASLLRPGGFLYLAEFHPFTWVFPWKGDLVVVSDYFDDQPRFDDDPGTYVDLDAPTESNGCYEWQHTLGDVVTAIVAAGLTLEFLHEHDLTLYARWPWLERHGVDDYRFPDGRPRVPLMYSIRARK
jgi:SAM-dependent methyltransferase